jgi:hypothetical protein
MTLFLLLVVSALMAVGAYGAWIFGGPRERPLDPTTPTRMFVLAYLGFYGIGSIILLITGESGGEGPLLVGGGLVAFAVGTWLAARRGGRVREIEADATIGRLSPALVAILAVVGIVCLISIVVQFGLPLLASDPQASRTGFAGLAFDAFRWLVPPASLVLLGVALARDRPRDRRLTWLAAAGLAATVAVLIELASRALVFELAIEALLIVWWAGRRLPRRAWVGLGAAGLVVFVGVQLFRADPDRSFSGADDVAGFALRRTINRVLLIHPRTLEIVATTIPAQEPYFAGATYFRRLSIVLGAPDRPSLGYWLYGRLFPGQTGGFAAPGVLGEAWANGGPLLAGILMLLLGAGAQTTGRLLARLPSGAADRAFDAIVVVGIARAYATSLNGLLLTLAAATGWWLIVRLRVGPPVPEGRAARTEAVPRGARFRP